MFKRGNHVPVTHVLYFKPPKDAFYKDLHSGGRRSAKEWKYLNTMKLMQVDA